MFGAARLRQAAVDVAKFIPGHPPRGFFRRRGSAGSRSRERRFCLVLRRPDCVAGPGARVPR
eukprot:9571866-Lingulodinium_polyedra.AAC.1